MTGGCHSWAERIDGALQHIVPIRSLTRDEVPVPAYRRALQISIVERAGPVVSCPMTKLTRLWTRLHD